MNEQTGTTDAARRTDPATQRRRIDALSRAHRARATLEHEAELAAQYGSLAGGPADRAGQDRAGPSPNAADRVAAHRDDVERLLEIHRNLIHERRVARRPFHRQSDRLVLALELAERLALDRLGFRDFAEFEARGPDGRSGRNVLDLRLIERAQQELSDAEAILAELDGIVDAGDRSDDWVVPRLPTWTVDPVLRDRVHIRTTWTRRALLGAASLDEATIEGRPPDAPLLPHRTPHDRTPSTSRSIFDRPDWTPNRPREAGSTPDDVALGEIVRDGRRIRIEKAPGLEYADGGSNLGPDAITYGDPTASPGDRDEPTDGSGSQR